MTVKSICQREVDLVAPQETAQVAAGRMKARNVGTLMVVDSERRPVGILTDRDLAMRVVAAGLSPLEVRVARVMTPEPCTIPESTPVEKALGIMRSRGVRRLPVVSADGKLVGVISLDDVLTWIACEFRELSGVLAKSSPKALELEGGAASASRATAKPRQKSAKRARATIKPR